MQDGEQRGGDGKGRPREARRQRDRDAAGQEPRHEEAGGGDALPHRRGALAAEPPRDAAHGYPDPDCGEEKPDLTQRQQRSEEACSEPRDEEGGAHDLAPHRRLLATAAAVCGGRADPRRARRGARG